MWIRTVMLSEPTEKPRLSFVGANKTLNRVVKNIAAHYGMPTITESVFRRERKIILRHGSEELFIEILLVLPPGETAENAVQ